MNTRVNFKLYRKIDVYAKREGHRAGWQYQHSTNAYPTCRAAAYAAQTNLPGCEARAWFCTKKENKK